MKITRKLKSAEEQFAQLGLSLPPAPAPLGVYKPFLIDGKVPLYIRTWTGAQQQNLITGRIGRDMDMEQGKLAARQVGLTILSTIRTHVGDLDSIKRVIKILGMVNCTAPSSSGIRTSSMDAVNCLLPISGARRMASVFAVR
jgi:hypothetical protein